VVGQVGRAGQALSAERIKTARLAGWPRGAQALSHQPADPVAFRVGPEPLARRLNSVAT